MSDSTESKGYYFQRLSKKNLNDLDILYHSVYNKPQAEGYFFKKYDTAYTGVEYTGFFAYNDDHLPIAFYGVIPCFIRYDDRLFLAAQSADTMTHPKYRYKGLFVQLANLTYGVCEEDGVSIIFGFPNQNALHGFLSKLKWQMTETMHCFIIPVGIIPLGGIAKRLPFLSNPVKKYQQQVLKEYLVQQNGIENSVFKDGFAGVNRNAHYLNYKTYQETQVIKIGESLLWIKMDNDLIIGDIKCTEEDFDETMYKLHKLAARLGLKSIHFHTSHQTKLADLFAQRYNAIPSFHVLFKDMGVNIELDKIKFTFADVDTF